MSCYNPQPSFLGYKLDSYSTGPPTHWFPSRFIYIPAFVFPSIRFECPLDMSVCSTTFTINIFPNLFLRLGHRLMKIGLLQKERIDLFGQSSKGRKTDGLLGPDYLSAWFP